MTTPTISWEHTPEITGRILAYREGQLPFAELLDELSKHDYADPPHYSRHGDSYTISEEADPFTPGTWGEVRRARNRGLLTRPEYEAIASGALRAHGA